ncbi:MAG TPA: ChaN family lipoprotein [Candidatus Cloacimonadota bacterium]|mgnify:CR=1 FL=1|nr:ChaN family lipoprotein [Candidatus Cloacimonadota bacterium]
MKVWILVIIMILGGVVSAKTQFVISDGMKSVDLKDFARDLQSYDLIFFGEDHLDKDLHDLQAELLGLLIEGSRPLSLSFEMWERDTQEVLDQYLAGKIDAEAFKEKSRAWTNFDDYLPLVDFAARHGLPALAANVPRVIASRVAREGLDFIDALPSAERAWAARQITTPDDAYKANFYAQMQEMGGHAMPEASLWRYYQSQCLKDDTMAESIVKAIVANPEALVIHFNGYFHSNSYLGTVSRVMQALPRLRIAVISPVYAEDWDQAELTKEHYGLGSHLLLLNPYEEES